MALWWKKYSWPFSSLMKPNPLSVRSDRIVPVVMRSPLKLPIVIVAGFDASCVRPRAPRRQMGLLALEPAVAAGLHALQRDDQPVRQRGLIDPADFMAVDPAHVALFEIGHCVQV